MPDTGNDTVAAVPGSIVPVVCRVCCTVCVETVAVRYVGESVRVEAYAVTRAGDHDHDRHPRRGEDAGSAAASTC